MSKLERGFWSPKIPAVVRLGEAFNVTTDYLLTGRGPQNPKLDLRFRERLPALEGLPEPQRDSLISFLDALIMAHRYAATPAAAEDPQ